LRWLHYIARVDVGIFTVKLHRRPAPPPHRRRLHHHPTAPRRPCAKRRECDPSTTLMRVRGVSAEMGRKSSCYPVR
jgi:hypothetical protein